MERYGTCIWALKSMARVGSEIYTEQQLIIKPPISKVGGYQTVEYGANVDKQLWRASNVLLETKQAEARGRAS